MAPWRTPCLATISGGGAPRARLVVLRQVSADAVCFEIHTDQRSAKWAELAARASAALLFWDPAAALQLRVEGAARLAAGDAETDRVFAALPPGGRRVYGATPAPGARLDAPEAATMDGPAAAHFGRLVIEAETLEALRLGAAAHHRARWTRMPPRGGAPAAATRDAGRDARSGEALRAQTPWTGAWLAP